MTPQRLQQASSAPRRHATPRHGPSMCRACALTSIWQQQRTRAGRSRPIVGCGRSAPPWDEIIEGQDSRCWRETRRQPSILCPCPRKAPSPRIAKRANDDDVSPSAQTHSFCFVRSCVIRAPISHAFAALWGKLRIARYANLSCVDDLLLQSCRDQHRLLVWRPEGGRPAAAASKP